MKKAKKIRLIIITIIVLAVLGYASYLCLNFFFYDGYKKYLKKEDSTFEEGEEFKELADSDPKVEGMVLVTENDILKLYTNTTTTEIAVYDKRSGEITYSNPLDRANDALANGVNKVKLNSQFILTYYDSGMTQIAMHNYDFSVEREQYEIKSIKDGIRYTYLCGNLDSPTGLVPPFITEERMQEKILSKLTEREAKTFHSSYGESSVKGFLGLTSGAQSSRIGMEKLKKMAEKAGYTQTDFDQDAAAAAGGKLPERTTFTIPLEYRLVDDKLVVTVPTDKIGETGSVKLGNIDLLPFMGAGTSTEEGYMFVPNGSGSLINFNNGKKTERFNQYIYGIDDTARGWTVVEETEKTRLPVYGIKHSKSAVFAEITNGDTLANILAEVAGNTNSYNYVYPSFEFRGSSKVSLLGVEGVSADLPTLEKKIYDVDLSVTYAFLEEKASDYSGMANYYRSELLERGELAQKETEDTIPFYLDILGGVKLQKSVLAVPYLGVYPMTTFDEAGKISDGFFENNITNLRVNYLGWFNGGYYHDVPKKVKVQKQLGGKKELKTLNKKLTDAGSKLFGDVAFQRVSWESDHYNYKVESAQIYAGYPVFFGRVNPARLREDDGMGYGESMYNILSPKYLGRYVNKFLDGFDKVNISGVSLRDLGDVITSDKKRTKIVNRQESKQIILAQLQDIDKSVDNVMINSPNAYSWAYASDLTNVPAGDNPFYIVDEEIPFYQMVIHGNIDYTSGSINLSDSYNKQEVILNLIEFGSAPHFTLSYKDSSNIKYSALNEMYSTQYETWMSDAVDIYQKTNEALKYVINSKILEHKVLDSGIKKITYDNGVIIYINSNGTDVTADNINIPAKSYVMEGVEQ